MYCTITPRYWYIPSLHWGSATKALCCVRLFNEGAETCHASQSTVQILGKFVKGFSKQHEFDSPNQWTFTRKWHGHWDRLLLFYAATSPFWPVSQGHPGLTYRHHCRHAALWRHQCVASGHAIPAAAQKQSQRHSADSASGILDRIFAQPEVRELEKNIEIWRGKKVRPSPSPRAASNHLTPFDSVWYYCSRLVKHGLEKG